MFPNLSTLEEDKKQMKKIKNIIALLVFIFFIVGCGTTNAQEEVVQQSPETPQEQVYNVTTNPLQAMQNVLLQYPLTMPTSDSDMIQGGVLRWAESSATPMVGIIGGGVFNATLLEINMGRFAGVNWSIFSSDESLMFSDNGLATYTVDLDTLSMQITLQYEALWHDGVPLTLDDLVFAYEVIAHPHYTGNRFTDSVRTIRGIMDYHNGYADYISGLVLSEDYMELTIYFYSLPVSHLFFGLWTIPSPRHVFYGIPVADMVDSDPVRVSPIGWGPFMVSNIIPGESVEFTRFDDFVWGAPILDGIVVEIVHPELIPSLMEQGLFDIAVFPLEQIQYYQSPTNFTYVAQLSTGYNYMLFRLGYWDETLGRNVVDPNRRTADVRLRRAMAYAVDQVAITENIWNGLRFPATSVLPPVLNTLFLDQTLHGYEFNQAKANELLDEAGFIEIDEEGYRKDPNGERFTLTFATTTAPGYDLIALSYIQNWRDVGLRVELFRNQTHEQNVLFSMLTDDDDNEEVDIMFGNWTPAPNNPIPANRWGSNAILNRSRFTTPEMDAALQGMVSERAFDIDYLTHYLQVFQREFHDNVPAIINNWRINLYAVNNRVVGFTSDVNFYERSSDFNTGPWHLMGLTNELPY